MKYALQERAQAQSSKAMDTSVVSRDDSDSMWDTYCKKVGWVEEVDYTQAYYDDPWDMPASTGPQYDAYASQWDVNAVALGKSKGKGKPKGYQSKGYQPSNAKGSKGFDKSGKAGNVEHMEKANSVASLRRTRQDARCSWEHASRVASMDTQTSAALPRD